MKELSISDQLLCAIVALQPSKQQFSHIETLISQIEDWDKIVALLVEHGSAPLFYSYLPHLTNTHFIRANYQQQLQSAYFKTLTRNMRLYQALGEILANLPDVDIMVLKGMYLAEAFYGDIALRQCSDIDILVKPTDADIVLQVLKNMGYVARASKGISQFVDDHSDFVHYPPMEKDSISIELHIKLHAADTPYCFSLDDIWKRSQTYVLNNYQVKVQSLPDLLMHICLHAFKHFEAGHIQLKCFMDVYLLCDYIQKNEFDWSAFEQLCTNYNCVNQVFTCLILGVKYYHASLPSDLKLKYENLFTPSLQNQFIFYLHGHILEQTESSAVPGHIQSLRNIKKPRLFLIYLKEIIFPTKTFMLEKYDLTNNLLAKRAWWLWYPYRWLIGAKGLWKFIRKS